MDSKRQARETGAVCRGEGTEGEKKVLEDWAHCAEGILEKGSIGAPFRERISRSFEEKCKEEAQDVI